MVIPKETRRRRVFGSLRKRCRYAFCVGWLCDWVYGWVLVLFMGAVNLDCFFFYCKLSDVKWWSKGRRVDLEDVFHLGVHPFSVSEKRKIAIQMEKNCDIKKYSYSYSKIYAKRNYYNYISLRYIKISNKEKSENSPSIDQNNYWATII